MVHGFIINPVYTEQGYAEALRDRLSRIPDLTYYVFTTGAAGDEKRLASTIEDIFEGEQLRIYCCGSTLTARNVMDGINDINRIELAIIPTQNVNYLEAFGHQEAFTDIEAMVNGDVTRVDYIRTNHGLALNNVAFGMDSYTYRCYNNLADMLIFGRLFPMIMSDLYAIFATPNYLYNIEYNGHTYTRRAMEISFYNVPISARNVVFADDWDIADGKMTYIQVSRFGALGRIIYAYKALKKKLIFSEDDPKNTMVELTQARVRHINGVPIWASLDGELIQATDWSIEVVRQGLKLVIPSGVSNERE